MRVAADRFPIGFPLRARVWACASPLQRNTDPTWPKYLILIEFHRFFIECVCLGMCAAFAMENGPHMPKIVRYPFLMEYGSHVPKIVGFLLIFHWLYIEGTCLGMCVAFVIENGPHMPKIVRCLES